jgi:hypothetical protein
MNMGNEVTGIECQDCGLALNEDPGQDSELREPCPGCGSKVRKVFLHVHGTVTMHTSMDLKQRRPGESKPILEQRQGDSLSTSREEWMDLSRRIDRANDRYDEVVLDPETGEIMHEEHGLLSEHRGHGSDKLVPPADSSPNSRTT